jgi:hypothetical protein
MYQEGDSVIEKDTGRIGILYKKSWSHVVVRFGPYNTLRYPDMIERAPLDIREEDIISMQHLAVETDDRERFEELGKWLKAERRCEA